MKKTEPTSYETSKRYETGEELGENESGARQRNEENAEYARTKNRYRVQAVLGRVSKGCSKPSVRDMCGKLKNDENG